MNMTKRTIDRRVARTRGMLQQALMSLILKKGYDATTVEDICEEANVGRSTFYAHYTSKDDLKRSGLDEHLRRLLVDRQRDALAAPGDIKDRGLSFSLAMFEHARDHLQSIERWSAAAAAPWSMRAFAKYFPIWCAPTLPHRSIRNPMMRFHASLSSNMSLAATWPC
jgi:AcrR family transcriptional regulator